MELTKRLRSDEAAAAGLPDEDVAEEDLLDTAWLQRLRRISQLQSARWVFPTAEHSRFTHGLGVMHEAGLWARSLYPSLRRDPRSRPASPSRPRVSSRRPSGWPACSTTSGTDRSPTSSTTTSSSGFPAPADARRTGDKTLSHEDLSQRIIEDELGPLLRGLRRAPGAVAERDGFADGESIDPAWVSFLISKPALSDPTMPRWVRWLQPLLSGVFTVDNLDYVRRDAYLTGVTVGPVDAERLRRYAFISERGLTLFEPGLPALEMFLTARSFMYQQVYFHRTVRAIDLDLADVFGPSVRAIFGAESPADRLPAYADLDEYALLHQAARWARGEDVLRAGDAAATPGDGRVPSSIAAAWQAILLRRPNWRAEAEVRAEYEAGDEPDDAHRVARDGRAGPRGHRPGRSSTRDPTDVGAGEPRLALERRDGSPGPTLGEALGRIPGLLARSVVATGGSPPDRPVRGWGWARRMVPRSPTRPPRRSDRAMPTPPGEADGWSCGRGGRTESGSIRAIWIGGTRSFLTTTGSMPNVAVSSGLNRP